MVYMLLNRVRGFMTEHRFYMSVSSVDTFSVILQSGQLLKKFE